MPRAAHSSTKRRASFSSPSAFATSASSPRSQLICPRPRRRPREKRQPFPSVAKRLSKILAEAGLASRRGSERLIAEGRVAVNGRLVTTQGTTADPERDRITVDGRPLGAPEPKRYVLLNKPRGYLTSRTDPRGRPVVLDFVREERVRLFPVGRLDFDAEGLLLLTNDGDLAQRLLHPRFGMKRVYEVEVDGRVT